jgi:PAS domain-containing protein
MNDALIATDREGKIWFLNQAATELTGWEPGSALGLPLGRVFRVRERIARSSTPGSVLLTKNGNPVPIQGRAQATVDGYGALHHIWVRFRRRFERPVVLPFAPVSRRAVEQGSDAA